MLNYEGKGQTEKKRFLAEVCQSVTLIFPQCYTVLLSRIYIQILLNFHGNTQYVSLTVW